MSGEAVEEKDCELLLLNLFLEETEALDLGRRVWNPEIEQALIAERIILLKATLFGFKTLQNPPTVTKVREIILQNKHILKVFFNKAIATTCNLLAELWPYFSIQMFDNRSLTLLIRWKKNQSLNFKSIRN